MASVYHGSKVLDALREAGLADDNTRRVIIDIDARSAVVIYTEKYGGDSVLDVVRTLGKGDVKTEIKFVDAPDKEVKS